VRTKTSRLGLLAAPLLIAQCAPACVPATPPPRIPPPPPPAAVFGCVEGSTIHWWLNTTGVMPATRGPLIDHTVTAFVDGVPYSDPMTIGLHPETSIAHFHGAIDGGSGSDVDLTVSGPDGITDLRANDLGACPVARIALSDVSLDCTGLLSVRMSLTVEGGQFNPPPQATIDVWAQVDQPSNGLSAPVVRLVDPNAGPLTTGTTRDLTGTGLVTNESWSVWATTLPVSLNGIDGSANFASDWPVQTMTVAPADSAC
jgi:hypothetical protein